MLRNPKRLSLFRARAAYGFWRRSRARLLLRSHRLSSYPWPMQFRPRFVFAVVLTRGQRPQAMQERARSAGRRRGHKALQREAKTSRKANRPRLADGLRPRAGFAQKSMSAPPLVSIRVFKPTQVFTARAAAGSTTAAHAAWRPPARAARSVQAAVALRARHDGFRHRSQRQASTRFVAQRMLAAGNPTPAVRWPAAMREAPVWRAPVTERPRQAPVACRTRYLPVSSVHRNSVSVIERHVHVQHRRAVSGAERRVGTDGLRSFRPFTPSASPSRMASSFNRHERAGVSARSPSVGPLGERIRTVASVPARRLAPTAVVTRAQRSAHSEAPPLAAVPRRLRAGVTRPAGIAQGSRRADGRATAALAHSRVRQAALATRQRFAFAPEAPQRRRGDWGRLRKRERLVEGGALVLRQPAVTAGLRELQQAAPRQAFVMRESRRAIAPGPSEPSEASSQRAPVVEEVRRILIPLLHETLFSEGTMGRLANGVVTEVDRRDSAEQYRKSGGR